MPTYINQPARPFFFNHDCSLNMAEDEMALQDNLVVINTVKRGEVLLDKDFGTSLHEHIFEQNDIVLWLILDTQLRNIVASQEPRIKIDRVSVTKDDTGHVVNMLVDWYAELSGVANTTTIGTAYGTEP